MKKDEKVKVYPCRNCGRMAVSVWRGPFRGRYHIVLGIRYHTSRRSQRVLQFMVKEIFGCNKPEPEGMRRR